jgi:DNA mismatch repair ATPase MutS
MRSIFTGKPWRALSGSTPPTWPSWISEISRAADQALATEQEIFAALVADVMAQWAAITLAARALAQLDVAAANGLLGG